MAARAGHVHVVDWLVQEGKANINQATLEGATPLVASLQADVVNVAVPRLLLSMGARVTSLDDTIFIGLTKAWIQKKVQKREVTELICLPSPFFFIPGNGSLE
jgi:hypothetical protein